MVCRWVGSWHLAVVVHLAVLQWLPSRGELVEWLNVALAQSSTDGEGEGEGEGEGSMQ